MYRVPADGVKRQPLLWQSQLGRTLAGICVLLACVTIAGVGAQPQPACPPLGSSSAAITCTPDAASARLFTPPDVPPATYRAFVSEAPIEKVAAAFAESSRAGSLAPGAWTIQEMDPLNAFGEGGLYDETKVGRLYVGRRARVARGPIVEGGRTVASITLVSPYPDRTLSRLVTGTLIIEFRITKESGIGNQESGIRSRAPDS